MARGKHKGKGGGAAAGGTAGRRQPTARGGRGEHEQAPLSTRRSAIPTGEPHPGASPGTLLLGAGPKPKIMVIDYGPDVLHEREVHDVGDVVRYLEDDKPTITWVDVRGISDRATFERLGEIFGIHPLALEDIVNVPQRPHTDQYPDQQVMIARMIQLDETEHVVTEQLAILFGRGWVLTVQEEAARDCLESVRDRIRKDRAHIRTLGSDYLAYALLDAVVDGFFPVLEVFGERLEDLEAGAAEAERRMSHEIHDVKRQLLTVRRAIWPQRDMVNALLRDDSEHVSEAVRVYLRDTYDHAVQVMDIVETYREIASGLMDLYLSGVSNRMNEVMKVLTVISTIFMPITFIAGVYGMNFDPEASPYNMPELKWRWGYLVALAAMVVSVVVLVVFYRRKGWIGRQR